MKQFWNGAREPLSFQTHFVGAFVCLFGTVLLIAKSLRAVPYSLLNTVSVAIFGASMIALYSASAAHHYCNGSDRIKLIFRKLDHSMIYVLIAGTYTPFCLSLLPHPKGVYFTIYVWVFALIGIIVKCCWFNAPRWLYTSIYIIMGWTALLDLPAFSKINPIAFFLILLGGVIYTVGGVMYALKKPNFFAKFGFHELFHVLIILATLCHFFAVYYFVA